MFGDPDTNNSLKLGAVNSINLARILSQIVYYFYAYFQLVKTSSLKIGDKIRFVVPTGNFGNVLAGPTFIPSHLSVLITSSGYFAQKMGLPIEKLVGMFGTVSCFNLFLAHSLLATQFLPMSKWYHVSLIPE